MKKLFAKFLSLFRSSTPASYSAAASGHKNLTAEPRFLPARNYPQSDHSNNQPNQRHGSARANYQLRRNNGTLSPKPYHARVGLVGINLKGFAIRYCANSDDAGLIHEIAELPMQVKMVRQRDIAGGMRIALQMLSRFSQGRTGIVILTSGGQTSNTKLAHELVETAVKWKTGVHVINIGHRDARSCADLADLTTRSALGYGQLRNVSTENELRESLRRSLNGLCSAPGVSDVNSVIVLVDCSERMVESFQGTTRIEMVSSALQDCFCNTSLHEHEKRMALAA